MAATFSQAEELKAQTISFLNRLTEAVQNGEVWVTDIMPQERNMLRSPVELTWQPEIRFLVVNTAMVGLLQSLGVK